MPPPDPPEEEAQNTPPKLAETSSAKNVEPQSQSVVKRLKGFAAALWSEMRRVAKLTALKMRLTRLKGVDLKAAHYAFGKECYELSLQKEKFATEFTSIGELQKQIAEKKAGKASEARETNTQKAKRVFGNLAGKAEAFFLTRRLKNKLIAFGQVAASDGISDGALAELERVKLVQKQIAKSEGEDGALCKDNTGAHIHPARYWGIVLAAVLLIVVVARFAFHSEEERHSSSGFSIAGPKTFKEHAKSIGSVQFASTAPILLTKDTNGIAKAWDTSTWTLVNTFQGRTPDEKIYCVALASDGNTVFAAMRGADEAHRYAFTDVVSWDTRSGKLKRAFKGPKEGVWALAISPDGRRLALSDVDMVALWDAGSGDLLWSQSNSKEVTSIAFSSDCKWLATGTVDRAVKVLDVNTGRPTRSFQTNGRSVVDSLGFAPALEYVYGADGNCFVWSLKDGKHWESETEFMHSCGSVSLSPNGQILASTKVANSLLETNKIHNGVEFWDPKGNKLATKSMDNAPFVIAFSPDSRWLAIGGADGTVEVVSIENYVQRVDKPIEQPNQRQEAALSPSTTNGGSVPQSSSGGQQTRTSSVSAPPLTASSSQALLDEFDHAVRHDDGEKVRVLLKSNPELVFSKSSRGYTALHNASRKGVAELLLANKADVNAKDNDGNSPLHAAVLMHCKDVAELLVAYKADTNAKNSDGETALHFAEHKDMAELLLANGADVNAREKHGGTPLHIAAAKGKRDVAELLLAHRADVNARGEHGETPLAAAIYYKETSMADMLLRHGGKK